jgi:hypothetical protein
MSLANMQTLPRACNACEFRTRGLPSDRVPETCEARDHMAA